MTDDNYSVCALVPLAAIYMLWLDRDDLPRLNFRPWWFGGLALLLISALARWFGFQYIFESAERYSLVLAAIGLVVLVCGTQVAWRFKWVLLFLFLMVPLPGQIHNRISGPLQSYATVSATFVLELLGVTVVRDGNRMLINNTVPLAVEEACSGLRMLTAFVITGYVLACVVNRPRWQRVSLVVSSIPVAIVCNTIRLVITATLFLLAREEWAKTFFHDGAGYTMMPMAIVIMVAELWLMARLVLPDPEPAAPV